MNPTAGLPWFETVVERYERPLLAYAYRMTDCDWQAAQDAVQETFLRLCHADRATVEPRLAAWLFTVCRSRVIDMQRKRRDVTVPWTADTLPAAHLDAVGEVTAAEEQARLEQCLDQLSPRQQEVLRLRLKHELSYRQIAEITGLSVGNVGFHLHQAVVRLRQLMLPTA